MNIVSQFEKYDKVVFYKINSKKGGQIIRADLSNNTQMENKCIYSLRKR